MNAAAVPPRRFGWLTPQPDGRMGISVAAHVLTDAEFGEFEACIKVVGDLRAFVIDHHALTMDFEALSVVTDEVGALITRSLSTTLFDTPATVRSQAMVQRAVSNFLAARSALRDRGITRQRRRGTNAVPTSAELKSKVSEIFDANTGYRFAYVLRNHAQHFENPVSLMPIASDRDPAGQMNARVTMMFEPAVLTRNKDLNAKVRAELAAIAKPVPLLPIMEEAMAGFERILLFVLRQNGPRLARMASYVAALFTAFEVPHDATPLIFNGFEPALGPTLTENCLLFGVDEMTAYHALRERLEHKLGV